MELGSLVCLASTLSYFQVDVQAYLGDLGGSVSDHHNEANPMDVS